MLIIASFYCALEAVFHFIKNESYPIRMMSSSRKSAFVC